MSKLLKAVKNIAPYNMVKKSQDAIFNRQTNLITPNIYNELGEKKEIFYLQDHHCRIQPYSFVAGRFPKNIHWDRFNQAIDIQFYTHQEILNLSNYIPKKRFAYYIESEKLSLETYTLLYGNQALANEFDFVFTTSDRHLNELSNARFMPAGGVWFGSGVSSGGIIHENLYLEKTNNVSILSSSKAQCDLHIFRKELAKYLEKYKYADAYGDFSGGESIDVAETLSKYRYSIVIENNESDYYFTEKILNCFASMTIPVYIGARKIGDFFNEDGIIRINNYMSFSEIENLLKQYDEKSYIERIKAIKENFIKVKDFICPEDWLYKNYKSDLIL